VKRIRLLAFVALIASAVAVPGPAGGEIRTPRFKAVAFDFLVLFNPDSVAAEVDAVFPGRSRDLIPLWRTRQFEYTWLRTVSGRYVDFEQVTSDSLLVTARLLGLAPTEAQRQRLVDAYLRLQPWPDAAETLRRLDEAGVRVIALANFSPRMLEANTGRAGFRSRFEALVSTDAARRYKPDPRAYQLGLDRLKLSKQDVLFAAFAGWDAAGARTFGYPTMWVNRTHQPTEELGAHADRSSPDLHGLLEYVLGS
jgi:2-haloacid dehalogenase